MVRKGSNKDSSLHGKEEAVLDPTFTKWLKDGKKEKGLESRSVAITTIQLYQETKDELKKLRGKQQETYDMETYDMIIRRLISSYREKKSV